MQFSKIILVLLAWCMSILVHADDDAVEKYRNYTPQQLTDLPEKERSSSVPMIYSFAARSGLSKGAELLFAMQLNTLMYPGVDDYENAVKLFQKDLGDKATGVLTVWQIHNLEKRSDYQKLSRVSFPSDHYSKKTDKYATVSGTMMIQDERIAWPVNHVQLKCYKEDKYCELDQLYLVFPSDDSWSQTFNVMQDTTQYYNITNWSDDIVDAVPSDLGSGCRVTALNLNFKTKEFYQITRNGTGECETMGVTLPKLERPRIAQIVDGKDIINSQFGELRKKAFSFLSSTFREKVEKLETESK
ncbi:hypothetical protein OOT55_17675 [Marinimicrobium sp. C6131]|uniref:hypothetical protein n=1 Tax=Marinimicrobium sp. C6131 TaxID=3022676 RepID=UPI00223DA55D|nr:hypothetical protein [Marinimicrobium sp. C6131]UZJ44463.1 hypothetical protein OOT55_17675 [Marinimicrobium sp. C6131]